MANPLAENANLLQALLGLFTDQETTSTTTPQTITTTGEGQSSSSYSSSGGYGYEQTLLSQEAVDRLLAQILENGGSGLAATAQGQKTAGLYNTTTMQQMIDDLMARAAGEVAVRGAKTEKVTPKSSSRSSSGPASNVVTRTTSGGTTTQTRPAALSGNVGKGLLASFLTNAALKKGANLVDEILKGSSTPQAGSFVSSNPLSWDNLNPTPSSWLTPLPAGELTAEAQAAVSGISSASADSLSSFSIPETPMFSAAPSLSSALSSDISMSAMGNFDLADNLINFGVSSTPSALAALPDITMGDFLSGEDALSVISGADGFDFSSVTPDFSGSEELVSSLTDSLDIPTFDISTDPSAAIDSLTGVTSEELSGLADGIGATDLLAGFGVVSNLAEGDITGAGASGLSWAAGNPIAAVIANLPTIGEEVVDRGIEEIGDPVAENVMDAVDSVSDWFSSLDDGCFITTAVCEYKGLADDCRELQVLRRYRDTWMKTSHKAEIEQYYREAPHLVELIHALPADTKTELLSSLWYQISEAVRLVESGYFNSAYQVYERMFVNLKLKLGVL